MTVLVPGILIARRYMIHTCAECGRRFRRVSSSRVYCAEACYERNQRRYQEQYQPRFRQAKRAKASRV